MCEGHVMVALTASPTADRLKGGTIGLGPVQVAVCAVEPLIGRHPGTGLNVACPSGNRAWIDILEAL